MSITFHSYVPGLASDDCWICHGSLDEEAVAHGVQDFHQMCKKCAKAWLLVNPTCPGCRAPVTNVSSFLSCKERIFAWLKTVVNPNDYTTLAFIGSMATASSAIKNGSSPLLISTGVIVGTLAGIIAAKLALIENKEAAFVGATVVTTIIINSKELAAIGFSDFMKGLTADILEE